MRLRRYITALVATVVATGSLAACGDSDEPAGSTKLKVALSQTLGGVGDYVALERGYFKDEGLDIEFVSRPGGATATDLMAAIETGDLDIGGSTISAGALNLVGGGSDVRVIGTQMVVGADDTSNGILIRKEVKDAGFSGPADLKGLNIGVTSKGGSTEFLLAKAAEAGGISYDDIRQTNLGFPDAVAALSSGSVDGAFLVEPFASLAQGSGDAMMEIPSSDYMAGFPNGVIYASGKVIEERPEVVESYLKAVLRGQRDYYEAFWGSGKDKAEIIKILAKHTSLKDPAAYEKMAPLYVDPNMEFDEDVVDEFQDYMVDTGQQQKKVELGDVFYSDGRDAAVESLGRME